LAEDGGSRAERREPSYAALWAVAVLAVVLDKPERQGVGCFFAL
jgi:hypothetical protein